MEKSPVKQTDSPNLTTIKLYRYLGFGIEVPGTLHFPNSEKVFKTLENKNYLFNDGKYPIFKEYSPKFKTELYELKNITGRNEIKVHGGNHIKHTRGCILLLHNDLDSFHTFMDHYKIDTIQIKTEKQ